MDDTEFDRALIGAALQIAAEDGWQQVGVLRGARRAGLDPGRARARFPGRGAILLRLGVLLDQAALAETPTEPAARERLFDLLMRRFDAMQPYRDGIVALLRGLPYDPGAALLLATATARSMAWMLEGAGISAQGPAGGLRSQGLLAVWLHAVRAWEKDDSPDLSGTMAALDRALSRAEQAASWLRGRRAGPPADEAASLPLPDEDLPPPPSDVPPEPPASPPA